MNDIIKIFKKNQGYARMKMLKEAGIHTRTVASACNDGIIEKIKPGLYKLVDYPWDELDGLVAVYTAYSSAIVCLTSAAEYYGLTTFNPPEISVAVPHYASRLKIAYPPVKVYYFTEKQYSEEVITVKSKSGIFNIYSVEKTIVDLFRYRKKIGDDIVLECLRNYLKKNKNNVNRLIACAKRFGVSEKLLPVIKVMVVV